ncbi:MAG TPA: tetratricopeptide repeat protein [Thermoanaerobaculia bacterium]|nr:tetratricopeptide repeat protein [Thermoanaerobaculia bacterium]
MKRSIVALFALVFFVLAGNASGSAQGRVTGKVTDSAGAPIEGVTLTLTTPDIKNFKISVKTDKRGQYGIIVNDATHRYRMRFERDGFVAAERDEKFTIGDVTNIDQKLLKPSEGGSAPGAPPAPSPNEVAVVTFNQGVDLLKAGNKDAAAAKFQESVAKNPDLPQGWQALATLAYQKKDWAKTLEYGQKATDLDPTLSSLYGMMADAAAKTGDKNAASEWKKKYDEANPDSAEMLYNKGIEAYNSKNVKEAETMLTRAVEAKPDFALAHFWLGMTAFTQNKKAPAREHLQKYLDLDPNGSEASTAKEILPLVK